MPPTARPTAQPTAAPLPAVDAAAARFRSRLMHASLRSLLDRAPGARHALPHLAVLETALAEHGVQWLDAVNRPQLARLYSQLSSLPLPADDVPLQELLARLRPSTESVSKPEPAPAPPPIAPSLLPSLAMDTTHGVSVLEITHSAFMAVAEADAHAAAAPGWVGSASHRSSGRGDQPR